MGKHMIHLPKNYKPYRRKKLDWCGYSNGICLEVEIFLQKWQEAKEKRLAYKIAKETGINPGIIRFSIHRAKTGKLSLYDRKIFEKFVNGYEQYKCVNLK